MSNKIGSKKEKANLARRIIMSALVCGGIGAAIGLLDSMGIIASPIGSIITLVVLGAAIGIMIGLFARGNTAEGKALKNTGNNAPLQLREEQLEISKELVDIADVTFHKEVITEEKTVVVPVNREELVVEKRDIDNNCSEVMRIPLTEEHIEIIKNPIKLDEVSIYRNQYQEAEHIEEDIKKETAHVEVSGNARIIGEDK